MADVDICSLLRDCDAFATNLIVVHTDSSTFKLYKIAQYIKVGCMEPEEFWLPTW